MSSKSRSSLLPVIGAVASLSAYTAFIPLPAQAESIHDAEGAWFSGYTRGRNEKVTIEFTVIRDIGKLRMEFIRWEPVGVAACEYLFNDASGASIAPILNGSYGTPETCPTSFTMGFVRTGGDTARLVFNGASFLDQADAVTSLRPLRDEDRRASVEGLDILGLATGMTQPALEVNLSDLGFAVIENRTIQQVARDQSWQQETIHYGREPMEDGMPSDVITIQYGASFEGQKSAPKAIAVQRDWVIPKDQNIAQLSLLNALTDKYGPTLASGYNRAWDRAGNVLASLEQRRVACSAGTLQVIKNTIGNFQKNINLYCGPEADIRVQTDTNGSRTHSVHISITDPDEVWNNFWQKWSHSEYQKMLTLFEGVSQASGDAPKL